MDPICVITAYTKHTEFTRRLNRHSAVNAYHFIQLYCTILNCPTLHLTKNYVDAFTYILSHPKLEKYRFKKGTLYRGCVLDDERPIEKLVENATILTTTYLSTTKNRAVAEMFAKSDNNTKISVFCTYNINNTKGRSALNIQEISSFKEEEEVLLLRYAAFRVVSKEIKENDRRIEICFEECSNEASESNNPELDNSNAIQMQDMEATSGTIRFDWLKYADLGFIQKPKIRINSYIEIKGLILSEHVLIIKLVTNLA
ncbi:unnamed protein product [Rotaria sp. Silwood1]|nr:unnamed protein product [Rotaria sp. Silwood1]